MKKLLDFDRTRKNGIIKFEMTPLTSHMDIFGVECGVPVDKFRLPIPMRSRSV